jgi:hypothetical protein
MLGGLSAIRTFLARAGMKMVNPMLKLLAWV